MILSTLYLGMNVANVTARNLNEEDISFFLDKHVSTLFEGFTLTYGFGYWKGEREKVAVLQIVHDSSEFDRRKVCAVAAEYKKLYMQEAVLVTTQPIESRLV